MTEREITVTVNGTPYTRTVEPRRLLADFIREDLGLTGTHTGCEHGVCGACTILLNGRAARSCIAFAVQMDGAEIMTVEGMATSGSGSDAEGLSPLQEAFWEMHGLQCGFCTPGFLIAAHDFLQRHPNPTEEEIREGLSGNICRCTGYVGIVKAIKLAAERMNAT